MMPLALAILYLPLKHYLRGTPCTDECIAWWLFLPPLCAYAFASVRPNTHFYVAHSGAALLAGAALAQYWPEKRSVRITTLIATVMVAITSITYSSLAFIRRLPEFINTYPKARPAIFTAPCGDRFPRGAFFGFPHLAGWKAVGALMQRGELPLTYASNEEVLITSWYLRHARRVELRGSHRPDIFIAVKYPIDEVYTNRALLKSEYHEIATVAWHKRAVMVIMARRDLSLTPRGQIALTQLAREFDATPLLPYAAGALIRK